MFHVLLAALFLATPISSAARLGSPSMLSRIPPTEQVFPAEEKFEVFTTTTEEGTINVVLMVQEGALYSSNSTQS